MFAIPMHYVDVMRNTHTSGHNVSKNIRWYVEWSESRQSFEFLNRDNKIYHLSSQYMIWSSDTIFQEIYRASNKSVSDQTEFPTLSVIKNHRTTGIQQELEDLICYRDHYDKISICFDWCCIDQYSWQLSPNTTRHLRKQRSHDPNDPQRPKSNKETCQEHTELMQFG